MPSRREPLRFAGNTGVVRDTETGKFTETAKLALAPERDDLYGLAFAPEARAEPTRGKGVLYGGAPNPVPSSGVGEGEPGQSALGYVFGQPKGAAKTLTVSKSGSGTGTVTSAPVGIQCGALCAQEFAEGETLTLTATAAEGSTFSAWSGECASVSGNECEVTMSAARAVTASFEEKGGGPTEYPLTTHVTGGGSGTIECAPPGGACGAESEYVTGTTVTLTAVADPGSEFIEWSGACAATLLPVCEVTINEATDVSAVFDLVEHTLSVSGEGEGEVSADSGTISGCTEAGGANCDGAYPESSTVTLTETPAPGSHFSGWQTPQCDESSEASCEITIGSGDEAVAATFAPDSASGPPLTLNIEEGTGTVVSDPAGIECTGAAPTNCATEAIAEGESVTLTASPASGFLFKGWKKCDKGGVSGRQCTVTLSEAKEVGAKFVPSFEVTLENSGGGKVSSKPGGALCLPNCPQASASFQEGKTVEVLAKPNKHFHLSSWGGDCSGSGACSVSSEATVSATFAEDPKLALSLTKQGGGQGFVKSKPAGLNCTYTCKSQSVSFYEGEVLELSWKLGKGTTSVAFSGQAGDCPGSSSSLEGSCHVTMDEVKAVVAEFE